jgi:hypothetical protein
MVISAFVMIRRFVAALRVALREEDFVRILSAALTESGRRRRFCT